MFLFRICPPSGQFTSNPFRIGSSRIIQEAKLEDALNFSKTGMGAEARGIIMFICKMSHFKPQEFGNISIKRTEILPPNYLYSFRRDHTGLEIEAPQEYLQWNVNEHSSSEDKIDQACERKKSPFHDQTQRKQVLLPIPAKFRTCYA